MLFCLSQVTWLKFFITRLEDLADFSRCLLATFFSRFAHQPQLLKENHETLGNKNKPTFHKERGSVNI